MTVGKLGTVFGRARPPASLQQGVVGGRRVTNPRVANAALRPSSSGRSVRTDPIRPPDAVNAPVVVVLTADCRSSLAGEILRPPCHCTDWLRYLFRGRAPFAKP